MFIIKNVYINFLLPILLLFEQNVKYFAMFIYKYLRFLKQQNWECFQKHKISFVAKCGRFRCFENRM